MANKVSVSVQSARLCSKIPDVYFIADDLPAARPLADMLSRRLSPSFYTLQHLPLHDAESAPWSTDAPLVIFWTKKSCFIEANGGDDRKAELVSRTCNYLREGGLILIRSKPEENMHQPLVKMATFMQPDTSFKSSGGEVTAFAGKKGGKLLVLHVDFADQISSGRLVEDALKQLGIRLTETSETSESEDEPPSPMFWLSKDKEPFPCARTKCKWEIHTPSSSVATDQFSPEKYFGELKTKTLGRSLVFCKRVSSTMDVVDGLNLPHGAVVIAEQQTKGKGRGGNRWISPVGCAMFSLAFHCPVKSPVFRHSSVIQHLAAIAMVRSALSLPYCQDLDLRLKWPNDVYFGTSCKIGGVLVQCVVMGNSACLNIGCGLNLANHAPTISIKSALEDANLPADGVTFETFFARAFREFENMLDSLADENQNALKAVCEEYDKRMLMMGEEVQAHLESRSDAPPIKGTIAGIDRNGYLVIIRSDNGQKVTLFPDGNRFDVMHGLIVPK